VSRRHLTCARMPRPGSSPPLSQGAVKRARSGLTLFKLRP
jgi:hypothetical protein